jgi:hypothetical protein
MDAGHVDEPVKAPESLDDGRDNRMAACVVRNVHLLQQQGFKSVVMGVRMVEGPQIGGADVDVLMQQVIHTGAANAASRAGDEKSPLTRVWHFGPLARQRRAFNSD